MKWKRITQWFMLIKIEQSICRKYANEKLWIEYKCLSQNIPWEEHILSQRFIDLRIRWTSQSPTADPCTQNHTRGLRTRRPSGRWKPSNRKETLEEADWKQLLTADLGRTHLNQMKTGCKSGILHAAHSQEGSTNSQEQSPGQREGGASDLSLYNFSWL